MLKSKKFLLILSFCFLLIMAMLLLAFGVSPNLDVANAAGYSYDANVDGASVNKDGGLDITFTVTSGVSGMQQAWVVYLFDPARQLNYSYNPQTHKYNDSADMGRDVADYYFVPTDDQGYFYDSRSGTISVTVGAGDPAYQGGGKDIDSDMMFEEDLDEHNTGHTFSEIFKEKDWYVSVGPLWTYTIDNEEDLIEITCYNVDYFVGRGSELVEGSIYDTRAEITPVVTISDWTYGDAAATPVVTENPGNGAVTYEYKLKTEDDSEYTSDVPTNAGDYVIRAKVAGTTDYRSGSACADFTIAQKPITVNGITAENKDYDGTTNATLIYTNITIDGVLTGDTISVTATGTFDNANIGDGKTVTISNYAVTGDDKDNYVPALTGNQETTTANIGQGTAEVTAPVANELSYTGSAQALVTAGATTLGELLYSSDGTNYSTDIPTLTDAGTYTVYYKVIGNENFVGADVASVVVTIAKVTPVVTAPTAIGGMIYIRDTEQDLVNAGSTTGGTLQYSLDDISYSTDIPKKTNPGDYTVYYRVVGDANYNDVAADSINVTIFKAEVVTSLPSAAENLVYNGYSQALFTYGTATPGHSFEYCLDGSTQWTEGYLWGTDAGRYTVFYRILLDDYDRQFYNEVAWHFDVTIAKADPVISTYPSTVYGGLVYNGSEQTLFSTSSSPSVTGGTIVYSLDNVNFSPEYPKATEVGEYTVYIKVLGDFNHNDLTGNNMVVAIGKASLTNMQVYVNTMLDYNGTEQDLVYMVALYPSNASGIVKYSLDGENYSTEVPKATNAGEYPVYVKFFGGTNYNDREVNDKVAVIRRVNNQITYTAASNLSYTGEAQALLTEQATAIDGTVQYKLGNGEYSTEIPTVTNAGNYTVYLKVEETTNCNALENSVVVTVAKVSPLVTAPVAKEGLVYTGSAQELLTAGTAKPGATIYYSEDEENYSTEIPKETNVPGAFYSVLYKVEESENYFAIKPTSIRVYMSKATPVVTPPTAIEGLVYNDTDLVLINPGSTTGGTLQYTSDSTDMWEYTFNDNLPTGHMPKTYKIHYKVVGGQNYVNVNTGEYIEVTIAKITPIVTAPTALNPTYNGYNQTIINSGSAYLDEDHTRGLQYSLDGENYSADYPVAKNAGEYTVYYKLDLSGDEWAGARFENIAPATINVNILKAAPTLDCSGEANNITYDGLTHSLLFPQFIYDGGTVWYSINGGEYSTDYYAQNAGEYNIKYKVIGDSNHTNIEETVFGTVTIAKATPTVTAPTAKEITYNATAQELVNAGSTNGGELQYSLDGENYSTSIPTGTLAVTYTVYYKVVGDANYNGVDAENIEVTISPKGINIIGITAVVVPS